MGEFQIEEGPDTGAGLGRGGDQAEEEQRMGLDRGGIQTGKGPHRGGIQAEEGCRPGEGFKQR